MSARMQLSRRDWLALSSAGVVSFSYSGWLEAMANDVAANPQRRKACILLWMNGGPSQMDTFDLKPGHANGGPFRPIQTSVPGIQISEHLPRLAQQMRDIANLLQSAKPDLEDVERQSARRGLTPLLRRIQRTIE